MDPATELLIVFVLLHVAEGGLWIRPEAFAFIGRAERFSFRRFGRGPLGNDRGGFVFLSPLPPFPVGHVVEAPPFAIGAAGVVPLAADGWARTRRPDPNTRTLHPDQLASAVAEGKTVRSGPAVLVRTSSAAAASAWARRLRALSTSTDQERRRALSEHLGHLFDLEAFNDRRRAYERATRSLRVLGPLTSGYFVVALYGVFYVPWVFEAWPLVAAVAAGLMAHLGVEVWSAHRDLFPGLRGDRVLKIALLLLSPPAAARARAFVARDVFSDFHPLLVARGLLDHRELTRFAGPVWRGLHHPLGPEPAEVRETLDLARSEIISGQRRLLEEAGVDVAALEAPPTPESDDVLAYCPRCHAQYVEPGGDCEDCPGVARRRFDLPSSVRAAG